MTFWKTSALNKSLKELQIAWYERLQICGFQDAEQIISGEFELRQKAAHPARVYRGETDTSRVAKEDYYRQLSAYVHVERFRSEIDRIIMMMFADGVKIKNIIEELSNRGISRCRNTIRFTVRKYEMKWGLREYTLKQLNKKEAS